VEVSQAANAVRLGTDWRPLMGLRPDDVGTVVERVLANVVMEAAVAAESEARARSDA
jgi:hypothetical protein